MLVPREDRRSKARYARAVVALVFALLAHGVMVALVVLSSFVKLNVPERPKSPRASTKAVVLRGLTAEQWNQNRGDKAPRLKDERKVIARNRDEKKPTTREELPKGQVVDVAPGNGEVDPNAKYLAESNNATKKETRAKEQTAFYRNAMPKRTSSQRIDGDGTDVADKAQRSGNLGIGDDDRPLKEAAQPKLAMQVPDIHKQQEVALKVPKLDGPGIAVANRTETQEVKGNSDRLNLQPGAFDRGEDVSAGRAGNPGAVNLVPSSAVIDKITGAAANDLLTDVDEGEGTYLNTREWKYASFFNRVKQSVGMQWNPNQQLRLRDPTSQIYGSRDRYTLLAITLDASGRLKDAYVEKSCGLDFLDLEAVKAFERAQPFPNPPPGLLASDQTIRFQFGFFLEMSGRPGFRLFRSAD